MSKALILIVCLCPLWLTGQIRPEGSEVESEVEETVQKEKFVQSHVVSWRTSGYGAFLDSVKVDTILHNYHNYHPIYQNSITNTYTGNYGGAYLSNEVAKRNFNTDFYFLRTHDAYLLTPSQIIYYNTTTPYTLLDYSQSENKNRNNETRFNVLHSQNVSPVFNVTFRYDQAKSDGQYNFQENKNHFIALYSAYTGEKLNVQGGVIFNRIFNKENGGMANDDDLLNTETEYVVMRLTDARSEYRTNYIFTDAEYRVGVTDTTGESDIFRPVAGVIYSFRLSENKRLFSEGEEESNSEYFTEHFLNPAFSHDSIRFNRVTNLIQLKFYESALKKYSFGKRAYAGVEVVKNAYGAPGYNEAVFPFHPGTFRNKVYNGPDPRWYEKTYSNAFIGGGIFRETGKFWQWNFEGRQYLTGLRAGQTELNGIISKPARLLKDTLSSITISGSLLNRVPDDYQQRYFSNRIKWSNNFGNEQLMNLSFAVHSPRYNLHAGANYSLINNYIFNDTLGLPAQTKSELLLLSAYVNKEFRLRKFTLLTHLLWQKASATRYIHLPDLLARLSLSYDMVVSKVLFVQMGADLRYNTAYYADAYHPVTGFFYLQNEKLLGNYPYLDGFANLKLKRTRVFVQYMNVASLGLNKPFFTALHHPMNRATFRLGVAWSFYN